MTASPLSFTADLPQATEAEWRGLVEAVLKGKPFDKTLIHRTADGIALGPISPRRAGAEPLAARAPATPWGIAQRIDHTDPKAANAQALEDLVNGATALDLVFAPAPTGFGLPATRQALEQALDGVHLDAGVTIALDAAKPDLALTLADHARTLDPKATDIAFGLDPLGHLARTGQQPAGRDETRAAFAKTAAQLAGIGGTIARADGRPVHAAGGSEAQELAFALAAYVAYWRALEAPLGLAPAAAAIEVKLAADADQFLTTAKFRAARRLLAEVHHAAGLAPHKVTVAAETAWRMMTERDPWVNLLRTTVAVAAAGFGGADRITVLPFTQALGLPDAFARRLARNTQLVLLEEANLHQVADPSAGAGGLEALTDDLVERAWALFSGIEAEGGLFAALTKGSFQAEVEKTAQARRKLIATRREGLTGTSEFPNVTEVPPAVLIPRRAGGTVLPPAPAAVTVAPLKPLRLAEPFERLRDAADLQAARSGRPVRVFLAVLGPLAEFGARATFTKNAFEAGGIEALVPEGFAGTDGATDLTALGEAFEASDAAVVCLVGTDDRYASEALPAAGMLAARGAKLIASAGRPGALEPVLTAAGVGPFLAAGADLVAFHRDLHARLGLPVLPLEG